jgi:hypothetical protein
MNRFSQLIFGSESLELSFEVPMAQAIERLRNEVSRTSFSRITSEGMVGIVNEENTKIQRVIPMVQNSFKPIFIGSFIKREGQTVLSGVLRFHRLVQIFMSIWFGFTSLWVLLTLVTVVAKPSEEWFFPLFGVLMLAFGVGLVKLGKWFSRNDKKWLSEHICDAVNQRS